MPCCSLPSYTYISWAGFEQKVSRWLRKVVWYIQLGLWKASGYFSFPSHYISLSRVHIIFLIWFNNKQPRVTLGGRTIALVRATGHTCSPLDLCHGWSWSTTLFFFLPTCYFLAHVLTTAKRTEIKFQHCLWWFCKGWGNVAVEIKQGVWGQMWLHRLCLCVLR